ncbi:unnamed protein product, partial [Heterobilharzia americana]
MNEFRSLSITYSTRCLKVLISEIVKEKKLLHDEAYKKFEEEKKLKKELIKNIQAEESSAIMTKSLTTKQ